MAKFYGRIPHPIKDVKPPLRRTLMALPDDYHVCLEFQIGADYDILIVHERGIYVIEVKNENRPIEGGTVRQWLARNRQGGIAQPHKNFFNQAKFAASSLKDFLRRSSREILLSPCSQPACDQGLCPFHHAFWWDLKVYPYLCIPEWNVENKIVSEPLEFCKIVQGSAAVTQPPFILKELQDAGWAKEAKTKRLKLSDDEIQRLLKVVDCSPITESIVFGRSQVLWSPKIGADIVPKWRTKEIEELRSRLKLKKVIAVTGEPKIGKSTLCQLLADDLNRTGTPIWDYDFRLADATARYGTAQFIRTFLSNAEVPEQQTLQEDIAAAIGVLRSREGLLVLDNFETALDDDQTIADEAMSQFVEMILQGTDKLRSFVIISSIYSFRTRSHEQAPVLPLKGIQRGYSIEYLTDKLRGWTEEQAERIHTIRQGNPHAMRLASSLLKDALDHGFSFDAAYADLAPKINDLTYGISYDRFSTAERLVAEVLSLHPTQMPVEAVEWILRRLNFHGSTIQLLMRLFTKEAITSSGARRFGVLPQNRVYVYSRIVDLATLHRSAMEYFEGLSVRHDASPYGSDEEVYSLCFYHAQRAGELQKAFDAFQAMRRNQTIFGFPSALVSMGRELMEHGLLSSLSSTHQAQVMHFNGRLYKQIGDLRLAKDCLEKALVGFQSGGDKSLSASVLSDLGLIARKEGDYERELQIYSQAISLLPDNNGDVETRRSRSSILGRRGQALQRKGGHPQEVFRCLEEALELAKEIDDRQLIVTRLAMLGTAHRELGTRNFPLAISCYADAVEVSKNTVGNPELASVMAGLAHTYEKLGDYPRALSLYSEALSLTKDSDVYGMLDRLGTLGHINKNLGRFEQSEEYYQRALELARQLSNRKAEAENLDELGSLYRARAANCTELARKAELLKTTLEIHRKAFEIQKTLKGDPAGLANRLQELGRTLAALLELSEAQVCFRDAIYSARDAGRQHLEGWQFLRLGEILGQLGRRREAAICFACSMKLSPSDRRRFLPVARDKFQLSPDELQVAAAASAEMIEEILRSVPLAQSAPNRL